MKVYILLERNERNSPEDFHRAREKERERERERESANWLHWSVSESRGVKAEDAQRKEIARTRLGRCIRSHSWPWLVRSILWRSTEWPPLDYLGIHHLSRFYRVGHRIDHNRTAIHCPPTSSPFVRFLSLRSLPRHSTLQRIFPTYARTCLYVWYLRRWRRNRVGDEFCHVSDAREGFRWYYYWRDTDWRSERVGYRFIKRWK